MSWVTITKKKFPDFLDIVLTITPLNLWDVVENVLETTGEHLGITKCLGVNSLRRNRNCRWSYCIWEDVLIIRFFEKFWHMMDFSIIGMEPYVTHFPVHFIPIQNFSSFPYCLFLSFPVTPFLKRLFIWPTVVVSWVILFIPPDFNSPFNTHSTSSELNSFFYQNF